MKAQTPNPNRKSPEPAYQLLTRDLRLLVFLQKVSKNAPYSSSFLEEEKISERFPPVSNPRKSSSPEDRHLRRVWNFVEQKPHYRRRVEIEASSAIRPRMPGRPAPIPAPSNIFSIRNLCTEVFAAIPFGTPPALPPVRYLMMNLISLICGLFV